MSSVENRAFIAIDYGRKRIGLAKSDPMGIIASALMTIEVKSMEQAIEELAGVIREYELDALIVGYPLLASGDKSRMCEEVDEFIEKLKAIYEGPIHKVDESDSSNEAASIIHAHGKRTGRKKSRVDRLAAVVILQRYLDEVAG